MRCDQCAHWAKETDQWEAGAVGFRQCMAARQRWTIQDEASEGVEWDSEEEGAYMTKRRDALKAARWYVQDGSEYHAELFTEPGFFCAQYAAVTPS